MMAKWIRVTFVGLKLPDICLTGEETPRKTSPRKLVPTGDRTRARWVTGAHATACSTAVEYLGKYLRLRETKLQENGESCIMLNYVQCILHITKLIILNRDDWDGQDMQDAWSYSEKRRLLMGGREGKISLGRSRRRWEDNIKMDFREVGIWCWRLDRSGSR